MTSAFGYSYVGQPFREVVRLVSDGFIFKGKWPIRWSEIAGYRAFPDFFTDPAMIALGSPKPRVVLYRKDGRIIRIRGDLLVKAGTPVARHEDVPAAFEQLVNHVRDSGIPRWTGPKEEGILFGVAFALFAIGFLLGLTPTAAVRVSESRIAAAVVVGVLLAQITFVLAPVVARPLRRVYIASQRTS